MAGVAEVAAGLALCAAGIAWALWAWAMQWRAGNLVHRGAVPLILMDEGPYRFSRHPMYLGLVVALLGAGVLLSSLAICVAAAALMGLLHRVQIPREEALLAQRFGGWWHDYAAEVRPWL